MMDYHAGEIEVQVQSNMREEAKRVSKIIRAVMPDVAARFMEQQIMVLLGVVDEDGMVWSTVVYGEPGFVKALDAQTAFVSSLPHSSDPVMKAIRTGQPIGILAIEFATRKRMRVNGVISQVHADGFHVTTREVYSNCPKYIQARTFLGFKDKRSLATSHSTTIDQELRAKIQRCDTLFIATYHEERGADMSHRGGSPGFIEQTDERTLFIRDYPGNAMFNTLGNITLHSQTGLLFLDFETGDFTQMNGRSTIQWQGTEKWLTFHVKHIRRVAGGFPLRWEFGSYSPFNPNHT